MYFEADEGDGFREPGFSKERRLEPQITVGLLTDGAGFPLTVHAFEGNCAETTTMMPVLRAFLDAHRCRRMPAPGRSSLIHRAVTTKSTGWRSTSCMPWISSRMC